MGRKSELYSCYCTLFLLAGDSLQTCSPTCGAGETRKAFRVDSVGAVPAACYLHIYFQLFNCELYAGVVGSPAGHRVNRSFGFRHHAGAVDPSQAREFHGYLARSTEWCGGTSATASGFSGEASTASLGSDGVIVESAGSCADPLAIEPSGDVQRADGHLASSLSAVSYGDEQWRDCVLSRTVTSACDAGPLRSAAGGVARTCDAGPLRSAAGVDTRLIFNILFALRL